MLSRVGPDPGCIRAGEPLEVVGRVDDAGEVEPIEVLQFVGSGTPDIGRAP